MDQRSLNNLNKEKPAHHEYEHHYAIPQEKIDRLFILLAEDVPLTIAAKEVGIKFSTAKKYFQIGDSRRGIEPLKKRLAILRIKRTEKFDSNIIRSQRYLLAVIRKQIRKLRKQMDEGEFSKPSYSALEKMIKLELKILGMATSRSEEITGISLDADDIKNLADKAERDAKIRDGKTTGNKRVDAL